MEQITGFYINRWRVATCRGTLVDVLCNVFSRTVPAQIAYICKICSIHEKMNVPREGAAKCKLLNMLCYKPAMNKMEHRVKFNHFPKSNLQI